MGGQFRVPGEQREEERPDKVQTLLRMFLQAQLPSQKEGSYTTEEESEEKEEEKFSVQIQRLLKLIKLLG